MSRPACKDCVAHRRAAALDRVLDVVRDNVRAGDDGFEWVRADLVASALAREPGQ